MAQTTSTSFEIIANAGNQILSVEYLSDYINNKEGIPEFSHIHTYTEIVWITKGIGKLYLDMQVSELETGYMYFIKPGQVHKLLCDENTLGYIITLSKTLLENAATEMVTAFTNEVVNSVLDHRRIQIDQNYSADILNIVELMIREIANCREHTNEILIRYFNIFLFYLRKQLTDCAVENIQNRNLQVSQQFKELVDKHYKTKKLVSQYAADLRITPNYLNEIIKKITGHSAGYLIRQRIALEAKRYAIHSRVCMKEIGYHLGFSDMAHFSKFFKSVVGSNFTDFKNNKAGFAIPGYKLENRGYSS
jgi:YesN/AraC family two-component response regulator